MSAKQRERKKTTCHFRFSESSSASFRCQTYNYGKKILGSKRGKGWGGTCFLSAGMTPAGSLEASHGSREIFFGIFSSFLFFFLFVSPLLCYRRATSHLGSRAKVKAISLAMFSDRWRRMWRNSYAMQAMVGNENGISIKTASK